jgi:hypothetical protein
LLVAALILGAQSEDLHHQSRSNYVCGPLDNYYINLGLLRNISSASNEGILQSTCLKSDEKTMFEKDTILSDLSANNETNSQSVHDAPESILLINATVELASDSSSNKETDEAYTSVQTVEEMVWVLDDLEYAMTHKVDHTKAIVRKKAVPFSLLDLGSFFSVVIVIAIVMSFTIMESHPQH